MTWICLPFAPYFSGDYPQAAMWIRKSPRFPAMPIYHLLPLPIFGEGGYKIGRLIASVAWLNQNQPDLVKNMRQVVSARLARSQDVEFFLGSLRKAGLGIADDLSAIGSD